MWSVSTFYHTIHESRLTITRHHGFQGPVNGCGGLTVAPPAVAIVYKTIGLFASAELELQYHFCLSLIVNCSSFCS